VKHPRLGLAALLCALLAVAGLSSCDAGRAPAAKVGQSEISADTLYDDLRAEAARAKATDSASTPQKEVEDTWSTTAAAELLARRIRYELLGEELAARHVSVTQTQRDSAKQSLCTGGGSQQVPQGECPGLKGYPTSYQDFQVELAARGTALQEALTAEGADTATVQKRYDDLSSSDPDQLEVQCYVGATVTDPSTIPTIQVAVAGGATFAEAVATVPGAEVQAGEQCAPSARINAPEVTSADPGTVLGPYTGQAGETFIVQVHERRKGTFEEMGPYLKDDLAQQHQQEAVEKLLARKQVNVDPRYGRWDAKTGSIVPPSGPSPTTTTAPVAG
jgi:hypothetical protein